MDKKMMQIGERYLVTTDNWFEAPDGKTYRAAWGTVRVVSDEILGIQTNRNSSNWFLSIGSQSRHIIVAGCQVHYAIRCEEQPFTGDSEDWYIHEGKPVINQTPTKIYIAE